MVGAVSALDVLGVIVYEYDAFMCCNNCGNKLDLAALCLHLCHFKKWSLHTLSSLYINLKGQMVNKI